MRLDNPDDADFGNHFQLGCGYLIVGFLDSPGCFHLAEPVGNAVIVGGSIKAEHVKRGVFRRDGVETSFTKFHTFIHFVRLSNFVLIATALQVFVEALVTFDDFGCHID